MESLLITSILYLQDFFGIFPHFSDFLSVEIIMITVFCPRAGPSLQAQETKGAVLPKAGLPPQTQDPRLQFY